MKYKQAGIVGVSVVLSITGWACSPVVNTKSSPYLALQSADQQPSTPQPSGSQPSTSPPSTSQSTDQQPSTPQLSNPQPSETPVVTDTPLSYKIETYNSKTMGGKRTYGVALPPGYDMRSHLYFWARKQSHYVQKD
ncbi:MAG TPA: hypothetical protein DCE56_07390 [Cyanobacteria bacterium UBA8553]|nr:hypothetical protein [Cyanobacteria bacterium UBA8553]HAJ62977.1 hypothetical protein [Cyanobacteria bacterium UBA8543]